MAQYLKGQKIGRTGTYDTLFYGASEAPRVHGITGAKYDSIPRFKNQYFVAFKYSNLARGVGIDPNALKGITHRVKSVDAPKFDIDTETLNQYNKPRLIPTRINYNPVTITFWDDKSNMVTNFWTQIYNFYFTNGRRQDESMYGIRDNTIVTDSVVGNSASRPGYNDYGYYIGNKIESMNLFQYMSLYLVANRVCNRIDLINPYLQSMQHDQFSQEMSNELAQNTITWGYENVVYYGRRDIEQEEALMGLIGGNPSNIFHWDQPYTPYHGFKTAGAAGGPPGTQTEPLYANTATGESTAPMGNNPASISYASERLPDLAQYSGSGADGLNTLATKNVASTGKAPTANDIFFYEKYGPPGVGGYSPKSGITADISEIYRALAAKETSYMKAADFPDIETWQDQLVKDALAAANVDRFGDNAFVPDPDTSHSVDDFSSYKADPVKQTGLDKTKTECEASTPAAGTTNRPTTAAPWVDPNTKAKAWIDPNTGKPFKAADKGLASTVAHISQQLGLPQTTGPAPYPADDPPSGR